MNFAVAIRTEQVTLFQLCREGFVARFLVLGKLKIFIARFPVVKLKCRNAPTVSAPHALPAELRNAPRFLRVAVPRDTFSVARATAPSIPASLYLEEVLGVAVASASLLHWVIIRE